jgi:hypothetical protein
MKSGDIVFAAYRNSLVEVLSVNKNQVTIIVETLGDLYYAVTVNKKELTKIGVLH